MIKSIIKFITARRAVVDPEMVAKLEKLIDTHFAPSNLVEDTNERSA